MNCKLREPKIWKLPKTIGYDCVPNYLSLLNNHYMPEELIVDLTETEVLHSSFVGFLIYAKNMIEKNNGSIKIILSDTSKKIFKMLNIYIFFEPNIITL
jgi:anti-anti-sigma regulatory factor